MNLRLAASIALIGGLLAASAPIYAHHGNVAYDDSKVVTIKNAVVTKVNWANPHVLVLFDVKDDNGQPVHWVAEAGSPSAVSPQGWTNTTLQPGDMITAYLYQVKSGKPVGRMGKIVKADGKELTSFGGLVGEGRPADCNKDYVSGGNQAAACRPDGRKTSNGETDLK